MHELFGAETGSNAVSSCENNGKHFSKGVIITTHTLSARKGLFSASEVSHSAIFLAYMGGLSGRGIAKPVFFLFFFF